MSNPIISVDGKPCPAPSSYEWKQEDLSNSEAGRTEDGIMHKNRIRSIISISLAWNNVTSDVAANVLKLFDPEYITATCKDAKNGTVTKTFYVGNRSAPLYNNELDRWSNISFNIVER